MARHATGNPLTDRLGALSDTVRLRMLRLLETQELSVGEVASVFQLPQSTVSRHLSTLGKAGWLVKRQFGTATYHSLTLDDLDDDARAVWIVVRAQIERGDETDEDDRRLKGVLAERKTDSLSFFGRVGGDWDAIRNELFGERITALGLLSLVHRDWIVADIGCGTGNAAELLAGCVGRVIAVDQSETMLQAARKRVGDRGTNGAVEFRQGSMESLPLDDASVDAACCFVFPARARRDLRRSDPERDQRREQRREREGGVARTYGRKRGLAAHAQRWTQSTNSGIASSWRRARCVARRPVVDFAPRAAIP